MRPSGGHPRTIARLRWDGFRAIVSTERTLRVRSRRGWNMTEHVLFLEHLPARGIFDGELVALGDDGKPDFPLISDYWRYEVEREGACAYARIRYVSSGHNFDDRHRPETTLTGKKKPRRSSETPSSGRFIPLPPPRIAPEAF